MEDSSKNGLKTESEPVSPGGHPLFKKGEPRPGAGRPKGQKEGYSASLRRLLAKNVDLTGAVKRAAEKAGLDLNAIDPKTTTNAQLLARVTMDLAFAGELSAIREIADRAEGKPSQAVEVSGPEGGPIPMRVLSREELAELKAKILADEGNDIDQ